jgi:hypothetical protein
VTFVRRDRCVMLLSPSASFLKKIFRLSCVLMWMMKMMSVRFLTNLICFVLPFILPLLSLLLENNS